jgi:MYXO-CTERM domain-containing protein
MKILIALTLSFLATGAVAQVVGGDNIGTPGHCSDVPNDPDCSSPVAVSEPGALWLLVVGGAAALFLIRRRRAR